MDVCQEPSCDRPVRELHRFTLPATGPGLSWSIAVHRRVECEDGHRYDEIVEFIDEPEGLTEDGWILGRIGALYS
jgi:hypothetical protein